MPVDPYSQMAFVEILNILLTAGHIVDVNKFLINRNTNPLFGSLSGYFRWSFSDDHLPVATGGIQLAALLQPAHIQHPFRDAGKP